jgi:hypothetical protein
MIGSTLRVAVAEGRPRDPCLVAAPDAPPCATGGLRVLPRDAARLAVANLGGGAAFCARFSVYQ